MKIIDILNKKLNGTLVDGFEFLYKGSYYDYFKKVDEIQDIVTGTNIGAIYELDKILSDEVEVIEENKEIEELDNMELINARPEVNAIKINELVRAVNKLNKDLNEIEREEK